MPKSECLIRRSACQGHSAIAEEAERPDVMVVFLKSAHTLPGLGVPESDCLVVRTARQGPTIAEEAERNDIIGDTIGVSLKSALTLPGPGVPESDCVVATP